jgi:hypothetical protein
MVLQPLESWVQDRGSQAHMVLGEDNQGDSIYLFLWFFLSSFRGFKGE